MHAFNEGRCSLSGALEAVLVLKLGVLGLLVFAQQGRARNRHERLTANLAENCLGRSVRLQLAMGLTGLCLRCLTLSAHLGLHSISLGHDVTVCEPIQNQKELLETFSRVSAFIHHLYPPTQYQTGCGSLMQYAQTGGNAFPPTATQQSLPKINWSGDDEVASTFSLFDFF